MTTSYRRKKNSPGVVEGRFRPGSKVELNVMRLQVWTQMVDRKINSVVSVKRLSEPMKFYTKR